MPGVPLQNKGLLRAHSWPFSPLWSLPVNPAAPRDLKLNLFEASPNLVLLYLHWLCCFSCLRVCASLSLCRERLLGPYCGSSLICHLLGGLFTSCLLSHFLFFVIFMVLNFSHTEWLSPLGLLPSPRKSVFDKKKKNLFKSMNILVLNSCLPLPNTWKSFNKYLFLIKLGAGITSVYSMTLYKLLNCPKP